MGDAGLEAQAVDEGFERRARRAHGVRHVDRAHALIVEIAGRADVGDHLARGVIDDEDGGRKLLAEQLRLLLGERFERPLHVAIDGQLVHGLCGVRQHLRLGQMRRRLGKGAAHVRHGLEARAAGFGLGDHAGVHDALQHAITRRARGLRTAVGAALLGRLRQRHEQSRFADRKPARLLAEVG